MTDAPSPTGLSASMTPVAITPINALSQAWRDALGLTKKRPAGADVSGKALAHAAQAPATAPQIASARILAPLPERAHVKLAQVRTARAESSGRTVRADAPRARRIRDLAEQIVHSAGTTAHIDLPTEHGPVKLLVQQHGTTTRIVAVCPPEAHGDVAEALERVRITLVKRGITVDAHATITQGAA